MPEGFVVTKPSYHCQLIELLNTEGNVTKSCYPTVLYAIAENSDGELFNSVYNPDAVFAWNLKSYSPGFFSGACPDENLHYFKQYLDPKSFNTRQPFLDYIEAARNAGYINIKLSIAIWTDEGLINQRFIPFDENLDELANEYSKLEKELNAIYLNSPDVVFHHYRSIFTNPETIIPQEERSIEISKDILDSLLSKEFTEGFVNKHGMDLFRGSQFTLVAKLNDCQPPLLKTEITVSSPDGKEVTVGLEQFLYFYLNLSEGKEDRDVFDINGNKVLATEFSNKSEIALHHKFTDYLKELRAME